MSSDRHATSPFGVAPAEGAAYAPARRLLGEFALAWARRAVRSGVASPVEGGAALAVLDPFAGADHPGSPPMCGRLLAAAAGLVARWSPGSARAWLLDEDPVKVEWVRQAVDRVPGASSAEPPDAEAPLVVALREADASLLATEEVARVVRDAGASLLLLDPPTAGRLPLAPLLPLLRDGSPDLLLRVPIGDVRRLAQYHGMPLADLPPFARRTVHGLSALLGDERHGWMLAWSATMGREGREAAERELVAALASRLGAAEGAVIRTLALAPSAPGDGPEYVLLATRTPELGLVLNEVLFAARQAGWLPWPEPGPGPVRFEPRAELELFDGGPGGARDRVVDGVEVAHGIATRFAGRTVSLDAVVMDLLESDLFLDDVRRALAELRRDGRAMYRSLASGAAEIAFPGRRTAPAPARRPRSPRAGTDPQAALFAPPDESTS